MNTFIDLQQAPGYQGSGHTPTVNDLPPSSLASNLTTTPHGHPGSVAGANIPPQTYARQQAPVPGHLAPAVHQADLRQPILQTPVSMDGQPMIRHPMHQVGQLHPQIAINPTVAPRMASQGC